MEVGTDMTPFPTVKHFCAWLGLAPRNDISGGKVLRSHTMKVRSRANQAFRDAAASVGRSDSAVGAYYRAMRAASAHAKRWSRPRTRSHESSIICRRRANHTARKGRPSMSGSVESVNSST
jgi:transposase